MTAEAVAEGPLVSPEQLALHPVDAAINTAANSPAKMLTLLLMARYPDYPFSCQELMNELNVAQGNDPGWKWKSSEGIKHFCSSSFLPAGLVIETKKVGQAGEVVQAFQISQDGLDWGVPLFGALLDLELRSEFSSQRTFGATNSNSIESRDTMRTSLVRLRILEQVQESQDQPVNLSQLRRTIPREMGAVDNAVEELTAVGTLRVLHKTNPAHRVLSLSRPDLRQINRYRASMKPETVAVYDAAVALYRRGVRELDGAMLLDEAEMTMPGADRKELWKAVVDQMPRCLEFADEARFGTNKGKAAPRTRIEVAREQELIVDELLRSVAAVRDSVEYRKLAAAQAGQILSQATAVAYLMGKAQAYSKHTSYNPDRALVKMERLAGKLLGWISLKRLLTLQSDWRNDAACRDEDPEIFYGFKDTMSETEAARARAVCADCISRLHCLKWAVDQPEPYGMWGGHTETERRNLPKDTQTLLGMIQLRD